jgi:CDP-diacylglycerol--glycerol-3-phosphate 3-phosphatidyltransferase
MKKKLPAITPATWITISRFFLTPFVLLPLLTGQEDGELITLVLLILAALTDAVDGFVARRFNQVSDLGKFLDPLADKVLALSVILLLVFQKIAPLLAFLILLVREIIIAAWRWWALRKGLSFSASVAAKIKTDCQWVGISLLLIHRYLPWPDLILGAGEFILYLAACMALYSVIDYLPVRRALDREN